MALLLALGVGGCGDGDEAGPLPTGETARRAAAAFYHPPPDRIPHELATNPGTPWGDYLGSRSCAPCHEKAYAGWRDSFHSRTLYDAVPRTVFGDFTGSARFEDDRFAYRVRPFRDGERSFMRVERNPRWAPAAGRGEDTYGGGLPARQEGVFEVLHAFGNRRHQPYVTRDEDGRHWVLPVYWNDVTGLWMWDGWRPYVQSCAQCHVTAIRSTATPQRGSPSLDMTVPQRWAVPPPDEGWAEGAVGCETCHGPGRTHVDAVERMGVPAYRAHLASGGAPTIFDPGRDRTPAGATTRMRQCDSCHNFFSESPVTWVPTPTGYDHEMAYAPITPAPPRTRDDPDYRHQFYEDGEDMSPCTVGRVFRASKMGKKGVECGDCHDPHGNAHWAELVKPLEDNALCLKCHEKTFPDVAAQTKHSRHRADGPGNRCAECHMQRDKRFTNGVQVMSQQIPSHAFTVPTGEDRPGGPPNACIACHTDRDAAWTRAVLEAWREGTPPPR